MCTLLNACAVCQHPQKLARKMSLFAPFLGYLQATRRRSKIIARKMRGICAIIQQDQYSSKQPGAHEERVERILSAVCQVSGG